MKLKHLTKSDYLAKLREEAELLRNQYIISENKKNLTLQDYANLIADNADIIKIDTQNIKNQKYLMFQNYEKNIFVTGDELIKESILTIQQGYRNEMFLFPTHVKSIIDSLKYSDKIIMPNIKPKGYAQFKNGLYNLRTKQFSDKEFFSFSQLNFDLLNIDEVNPEMLKIVRQILNEWSDHDPNKLLLIKQILMSSLEGYGRKKYIIIKGPGGNGKSTLLKICEILTGGQVARANLHEILNDNYLNQLSIATQGIFGDDLESNLKLSGKQLARWKTLVDGGYLQAEVKYQENAFVKCECVMLQCTNTDVTIYENTDAVKDRIIELEWTKVNYRRVKNKIDLDNLMQNKEFIEALISLVIYETPYFEEFIETAESQESIAEQLNNADPVAKFVEYLEDNDIFKYPIIVPNLMYQAYSDFNYINNPGSTVMSNRLFNSKFTSILKEKGYALSPIKKRFSNLNMLVFNPHLLKTRSELLNDAAYSRYSKNLDSNTTQIFYIKQSILDDYAGDIKLYFKEVSTLINNLAIAKLIENKEFEIKSIDDEILFVAIVYHQFKNSNANIYNKLIQVSDTYIIDLISAKDDERTELIEKYLSA